MARRPAATDRREHADDNSVAIIGMGCIFPGAAGLAKFWETLSSGARSQNAAGRAALESAGPGRSQRQVTSSVVSSPTFNTTGATPKSPPKQIAEADPLQFMFLEAAEQALADAGYDRKPLDRDAAG